MFVTNYNYGIKLIDLIDYNGDGTFDELLEQVSNMLTIYCKDDFFTRDDILWNDFIKRFTRRFMFRTLSYDTYMNFCIKLSDVFTRNREKLKKLYEVKMLEFNPLWNKNLTTDTENIGTTKGQQKVKRQDNKMKQINRNEDINKANKSEIVTHNQHLDDSDEKMFISDTPRSSVKLGKLFEKDGDSNYIVRAENDVSKKGGSNDGTSKGTINDDITNKIKEKNTDNIIVNGVTLDDFTNSTNGKMLLYGYDKYPVDLLRKYMNFVIDVNEYLLTEIEDNHLFMSIII